MEYKIVTIKERPDLCEEAAQWFHSKWEGPADAYLESMKASLLEDEPVPGWYLCLYGEIPLSEVRESLKMIFTTERI